MLKEVDADIGMPLRKLDDVWCAVSRRLENEIVSTNTS